MPLNYVRGVVLVAKWYVHLDLTAVASLRSWRAREEVDIHGRGDEKSNKA